MSTDVSQPPQSINDPRFMDWIFRLWKRVKEGTGSSGTFTPGLSFGGGSTGMTFSLQTGSYLVVGNRCFVNGIISLSAKGSSTGNALITGLPFTVLNDDAARSPLTISCSSLVYSGQFQSQFRKNETTANLQQLTEAGTLSALTDTAFSATTSLFFAGSYRTS